jgi:hypothetical protein
MSFDDPIVSISHRFLFIPYANCVLLNFSQVIHGNLKLNEALRACCLQGVVSFQKLHYHVKIARKALLSHAPAGHASREGLLIGVCGRASSDCTVDTRTTISPLTEASALSAAMAFPQQPLAVEEEELLPPVVKRRKSSKQTSEARAEAKIRSELYNQRFKNAFKEGTDLLSQRITRSNQDTAAPSSLSVDKLVADLNQKYNLVEGNKKLSKTTLYRAVRHGKVGESPMKRGPAPKIPDVLLEVTSLHAEVSQVGEGGELRGREIKRILGAAVIGTKYEHTFTVESAWKKLRSRHPERLQAGTKVSMEEARSKWTTVNNLEQWFDDVKADLINSGLVIDREVRDEEGVLMSEVDFRSDDVRRRIINMDETHHDLSITGDKGGSRALVYSNPKRQRGFKKTVKAGRHVTGVYATNAAGEALPPLYIFDSGAKIESNFRVKLSWLNGLPTISGRFGCPSTIEQSSYYSVRARGSMDDSLFNDYIERVVLPLYPNISKEVRFDANGKLLCGPVILKVDSGPGRIVANLDSISKRAAFRELGLLILMGLPNATSVNQEMDALYGAFKSATYARGEVILTERMRLRGLERSAAAAAATINTTGTDAAAAPPKLTPFSMGFEDLSTVVDGNITDDVSMKPFTRTFTREKILRSWSKVGFCPFTRNCVQGKKVRHELGQASQDKALEDLHESYTGVVSRADQEGLNAGIFDGRIPVAKCVNREPVENDQVKKLVETKGSFSAGGLWSICGTRIGNASVVLRAQTEQLAIEADKAASTSQSKLQRRAKLLLTARQALLKHENAPATMTDKDWIDIVRWVLPESNADGLLKDLRKKDVIIQKLMSLDRDWKTYIPTVDEV